MNQSVGTAYYKIYNNVNFNYKVNRILNWTLSASSTVMVFNLRIAGTKRTLKILAVKPQQRFSRARSWHRFAMQNRGDFIWWLELWMPDKTGQNGKTAALLMPIKAMCCNESISR